MYEKGRRWAFQRTRIRIRTMRLLSSEARRLELKYSVEISTGNTSEISTKPALTIFWSKISQI